MIFFALKGMSRIGFHEDTVKHRWQASQDYYHHNVMFMNLVFIDGEKGSIIKGIDFIRIFLLMLCCVRLKFVCVFFYLFLALKLEKKKR